MDIEQLIYEAGRLQDAASSEPPRDGLVANRLTGFSSLAPVGEVASVASLDVADVTEESDHVR